MIHVCLLFMFVFVFNVGPSSPAATTSQSSLSCLFQSQSEQIEKLRKISFQSQSEVNFVGHRFTVDKEKLKSTSRVELKSISQSSHHSIRHVKNTFLTSTNSFL